MKLKITLFSLFFIITNMVYSQPWMEYVDADKKKQDKVTFFDIQKAFNKYEKEHNIENGYLIKDGEKHKAGGWKQYKRWEHFWEVRVDPETGEFPEKTPFQEYKKSIQNKNKEKLTDNSNWVNLGTDSSDGGYHGIGRLNCIEFHPEDENTYWVGAPSGGLWETTNDGASWKTLTDTNTVIGVSDIAIPSDYETSETIYIATGDRDAGDNYSTGVLKSTDGGVTWKESLSFDVANTELVNHLLIDPNDDNILTAATTKGIMKTTDAGESWNKIANVTLKDIEFKPGNAGVIYGSTSSDPTKIYRSVDSGKTWTESLSKEGNRTELTVSADDPEVVYAVVANTDNGLDSIYKSTNSGVDFSAVYGDKNLLGWESDGRDEGGQGWYDLTIIADPNHADTVFVGGINTWRSVDGGNNWEIVNHWWGDGVPAAHADKHAMEYQNGTSVLFEGNDGGIYRTTDSGESWEDLTNGMVISQIYKLATAQSDTDIVINGLQDNGTKLYHKGDWYDVMGGDGMKCMIDYTDADIQYGTVYYGDISRTTDMWSSDTKITPSDAARGAWVTPFAMHPENSETIYGGYADLWKSTDKGANWSKISDVTSNNKLRSIAISESNPDYIYIADLYNIWKTEDGGNSWADITDGLPVSDAAITNIEVHYSAPDTIWVSMGGYDNNNVYETIDGGNTWSNVSAGLPDLPVLDVIQDKSFSDSVVLYAGTDVGAYRKTSDSDWSNFSNQLPNVIVNDLDIYYDKSKGNNVLRAATYGRGLWERPIPNKEFLADPDILKVNPAIDSIEIEWDYNSKGDTVLLAVSEMNSFSEPSAEIDYNSVDTLEDGEEILYFDDLESTYVHDSLKPATAYNYKIWSYDGESFSSGIEFSENTLCDTPSTQVSNVEFTNIKEQSVDISWERGNGDGVLIMGKTYISIDADPVSGQSYTANKTFGEGDEIGENHFVVFNDRDDSTTVEGLKQSTKYNFALYEYNSSDNCYHVPGIIESVETELSSNIYDEEKENSFSIYPNPANESIELVIPSSEDAVRLEIVDMSGKTVLEKSVSDRQILIDIKDWNSGAYIVRLHIGDEVLEEKLMVK
ncbi:MAG: VPS10 domain-containing protein [Bacteroidota bacterium]